MDSGEEKTESKVRKEFGDHSVQAQKNKERIFEAAEKGDLETLKTFSREEIGNHVNRHKSNALHWAAGNGHLETCQWLVSEVGIPIDYKNKQHRTALHWAARSGQENVANWLLDEGVPIDSLTKDGTTPLQWAIWQGQKAMCILLLNRGANIHHKNYFHCTAAHWACMGDMDSEFLDFLQSFGVDFSPPNNMGHTPLGKAAFKGHEGHCDWLVKNLPFPDLNISDKNGMTPAMQAANNGFTALAKNLTRLAKEQHRLHPEITPGKKWIEIDTDSDENSTSSTNASETTPKKEEITIELENLKLEGK